MVKTVFGCGDREEAEGSVTPEDYSPDHFPVNMMNIPIGWRELVMTSPLTTVILIHASKLVLINFFDI